MTCAKLDICSLCQVLGLLSSSPHSAVVLSVHLLSATSPPFLPGSHLGQLSTSPVSRKGVAKVSRDATKGECPWVSKQKMPIVSAEKGVVNSELVASKMAT